MLGAIGFLVIHNSNDPDDVVEQDLPHGQHNGRLTNLHCFPFPFEVAVLPHHLEAMKRVKPADGFELVPATEAAEETFELVE